MCFTNNHIQDSDAMKLYEKAKKLDEESEKKLSNSILKEAIQVYKEIILKNGKQLNDKYFKEISKRCIERMRFLGSYNASIEIHEKLIERFDEEVEFRNQLAVTYLMCDR